LPDGRSVSEVASRGVSRQSVHPWLRRSEEWHGHGSAVSLRPLWACRTALQTAATMTSFPSDERIAMTSRFEWPLHVAGRCDEDEGGWSDSSRNGEDDRTSLAVACPDHQLVVREAFVRLGC
jgi:hypothetical protein